MTYSEVSSRPLALEKSTEAQIYALFAVALGLTGLGVFVGMQFAAVVLSTGLHLVFLITELALIFTARFWMDKTPLNYILFALFPTLSGFTVTPYLLSVLAGYVNGGTILLNAFGATFFMAGASAGFSRP